MFQIPDVHDNVRYDGLHNAHLELDGLHELYDLAKHLADSIVPQEYGITKRYSFSLVAAFDGSSFDVCRLFKTRPVTCW